MESLATGVTEILGDVIRYFRHSATSYYGDNLFFISIVMGELKAFKDIPRIIMLDSDLRFKGDIADLWDQFDDFSEQAVMGIAHEQQPVYRHVFRYEQSLFYSFMPNPSSLQVEHCEKSLQYMAI